MRTTMENVDEHNLIVSTEDDLPEETIFGAMALVIATGEIKIYDEGWKTL